MVVLQHGFEPIPGYVLEKKLGAGSFGVVWSALGPGHTRVALKFLNLHHAGGAKEYEAISVIKNVRHPNLLPITGYWLLDANGIPLAPGHSATAGGHAVSAVLAPPETFVIAMVAADCNLDEVLRSYQNDDRPGIPVDELIEYMDDAAKGLDYLNAPRHDLGDGKHVAIQHRDIKPENILVVGDSAVLCDFGVSRPCREKDIRTTGMIGSPAFISPESIDGRSPSTSSDQYSLALTYYYLRTGSYAVQTKNQHQAIQGHLTGQLDFGRVGPEEQEHLKRATHLDESKRFPTCREFIRAVAPAALGDPDVRSNADRKSTPSHVSDTKEVLRCQSTTTPEAQRDHRAVMDRIDRINSLHQSGRQTQARSEIGRSGLERRNDHASDSNFVRRILVVAVLAAFIGIPLLLVSQSNPLKAGFRNLGTETARFAVRESVKSIVAYPANPAVVESQPTSKDPNPTVEKAMPEARSEPPKVEAPIFTALVESTTDDSAVDQATVSETTASETTVSETTVSAAEVHEPDAKSALEEAIGKLARFGAQLSDDQTSLELSRKELKSELFELLIEFPTITSVNAEGSGFNDHHLELLSAALPDLQSLFLAETRVTNRGLESIVVMGDLSRLDLTSCDVDDQALNHLESLTNLHVVGLRGTRVSGRGLEQLSEALHNNVVIQGPRFNLLGGKRIGIIQ